MNLKHLHSAWHRADTPRISNITHYYYFCHCCCPFLPLFPDQGAQRMEIPHWQPLITGLMAMAHCPALVNQEDSALTNPSPQDSLGLPQKSPRAT